MPTVSVVDLSIELKEIEDTQKVVKVPEGSVIFDALDDQDITLPHGCLSGSCGSCRVVILEGIENISAPSVVEADTISSLKESLKSLIGDKIVSTDLRLTCRAKVLSGSIKIGVVRKN